MSSQRQHWWDAVEAPSHLLNTPSADGLSTDGDREYTCAECRRRVTRATDGAGEYGHEQDCEYKFTRRLDDA